jgi:hypothetical protein
MNTFKMDIANVGTIKIIASDVVTKAERPDKFEKAWKGAYKHQNIIVIHEATKKQFSFDYYGAQLASMVEDEEGAITSVYSYLSDAWVYYNDDFNDLGYNKFVDKETFNQVYNGCKKAYYKVARWFRNIGIEIDLCDLLNQLQEDFNL